MTKASSARNLSPYAPESRRRAPRVPLGVWVTVEHEGTYFDAFAANIGVGGAFVETQTLLPYEARLVLHVPLPGASEVLRLPGVVRWSGTAAASQTGFGIQFLELGAKETHQLSELVRAAT